VLPIGDPARAFRVAGTAPGTFYDTRAGAEVAFEAMIGRMARADVVLLGEEHTSAAQKELQARILAAVAASGRKTALGMEFFQRDDADVLRRWLDGTLAGDEFLLASGWYDRGGYRFDYYRPQMEVARRNQMPIVGLNVPRDIVRAVNRGGLGALSEAQRAIVGEVTTAGAPQHRFLVERFFGEAIASMPAAWLDNMYAAQCVWDVAMARTILGARSDGSTMVVIVGSGHVAYGLGIARRLAEERLAGGLPALDVITLVPVEAPPPAEEGEMRGHPGAGAMGGEPPASPAVFSRSLADFVAAFSATGGLERFPRLGVDLETGKDGAPAVKRVWPDTPAQHSGLETGDAVIDVNGVAFADLSHLRLALARLEWGERVDFRVRRGEKEAHAVVLLAEDPVSEKQRLVPGWAIEDLTTFDPGGAAVVSTPPAGRTLRLVRRDGRALRVEERDGTALLAVHRLDDQGRAACSLYRDPLPDGAVKLCYTRDAAGVITATTRLDRSGRPI
jgi:uncharacterized iron-regulated protein